MVCGCRPGILSALGLDHKSCLVKCGKIFVLLRPFVHISSIDFWIRHVTRIGKMCLSRGIWLQLTRAAVELAKAWRTDKFLRRLDVCSLSYLLIIFRFPWLFYAAERARCWFWSSPTWFLLFTSVRYLCCYAMDCKSSFMCILCWYWTNISPSTAMYGLLNP